LPDGTVSVREVCSNRILPPQRSMLGGVAAKSDMDGPDLPHTH
jgi:hypothetical protein